MSTATDEEIFEATLAALKASAIAIYVATATKKRGTENEKFNWREQAYTQVISLLPAASPFVSPLKEAKRTFEESATAGGLTVLDEP